MLRCETNTPTMEKKVLTAGRVHFRQRKNIHAVFEHGQWWIKRVSPLYYTDEIYSVIDAVGTGTTNGFGFEKV